MIDWLKRAQIDPEIELNGKLIPINLRRHRTAKRLTMRLAPDGSAINITLPKWAHANEALAFSGIEAGAMDVAFFRSDETITQKLDAVGLRFELPQLQENVTVPGAAPGMDPDKPPKLK